MATKTITIHECDNCRTRAHKVHFLTPVKLGNEDVMDLCEVCLLEVADALKRCKANNNPDVCPHGEHWDGCPDCWR